MKNYYKIFLLLFTIIFVGAGVSYGQPTVKVFPDTLKYTSTFDRLQHLTIYNEGGGGLTIDSIYIDDNIYYARFDINPEFPLIIQPADSLVMDCIFWNYWSYTSQDYDSSIVIYSGGSNIGTPIASQIDINNVSPGYGQAAGTVVSGGSAVQNAKVFFYRNGVTLTDSAATGENGNYNIYILAGSYFVAVEKEGYNLSYYSNRVSPVDADFIDLLKGAVLNMDFNLEPVISTGFSISGNILDKKVNGLAKKSRSGVVIASKGDHNPSKISGSKNTRPKIYTGVIYSDGSYYINNIQESGYYYIQAFSEFYLPGYYSELENGALFWQDADTVYIDRELNDYNIYLERDSSYGAGIISGKVNINLDSNFVNTIVYAQSESNGMIYTHNFVDANGNYRITGLPYGEYKVIAQAINYENAVSSPVKIDKENTVVSGINLEFLPTDINDKTNLPDNFVLHQNYPNPFNPETIISFTLAANSFVSLKVFDILGKEVATLVNGNMAAGFHKVSFNASKAVNLPSGVYFYALRTPQHLSAKKMILIK